jgi:hypothetical protein
MNEKPTFALEDENETPVLINGARQGSFNSPTAGDSSDSDSDSDAENGLNDVLTDDLGAIEADGQAEPENNAIGQLEAPAKRRRGAPDGNLNNFQNGSSYMQKARRGDLPAVGSKTAARRFAKALIADLGGKELLSAAKLEIIDHLKRDKETLEDMLACRDELLLSPKLKKNIAVLAKLDNFINPVQVRICSNLVRLGLERVVREIEIAPWEQPVEGKK